jgi:RND family efflux transporter MFP subunit
MRSRVGSIALILAVAVGCGSEPPPSARTAPSATVAPSAVVGTGGEPGWTGVVVASHEVDLTAALGGRLAIVEAVPGDRVERGQRLARVASPAADARVRMQLAAVAAATAEIRRAASRAVYAEAEWQRRRDLGDLASRQEIAAAEQEAREAVELRTVAQATYEELSAALAAGRAELGELEIRAPFSGVVSQRYVDPGASVAAGERIVRLLSLEVAVRFAVPPAEASRLAGGLAVMVRGDRSATVARITRLAPEIDPPSGMVFVEGRLDEALAWRVGDVVKVTLPTGGRAAT